ncbi:hypothetical protein [Methylobacterium oxalidis]|uniref:Uncharacterized protein n=1 Tax=Methylobacterium oxalidis TaxID=944322 RepID=A0A512JAN1_9HYPH|nr:hypothetical protein [Methylobacterium oxalidis]GEP07028.1 hypothetical protein MOX02_50660 [Methylobacterium oxalidis]GJE29857.1 hypothetical protein LDDCCGHA_0019 [Methylobacterium oxalidis]GLS64620.1 hypothetical protein GCM10007888_30010 [Methylobacterium oxalidis]
MADDYSKERKQAEAEFAKTQDRATLGASKEPAVSAADENTARLKAARLARDAADEPAKGKGRR